MIDQMEQGGGHNSPAPRTQTLTTQDSSMVVDPTQILKPKPTVLPVLADNIPDYLKSKRRWVLWRYEAKGGRWTKVPYNPHAVVTYGEESNKASTTKPSTWGVFDFVLKIYESNKSKFAGIGYVLSPHDGLVGIDIDHCRGTKSEGEALKIDTYAEYSPSGTGLRLFGFGTLPNNRGRKNGDFEIYNDVRFLTVTGQVIPDRDNEMKDYQETVDQLLAKYFPEQQAPRPATVGPTLSMDDAAVLRLVREHDESGKFAALLDGDYPALISKFGLGKQDGSVDRSRAHQSLCSKVAFYTQDAAQIERLVSSTDLGQNEKWADRPNYRQTTIAKALNGLTSTYSAPKTDEITYKDDELNALVRPFDEAPERVVEPEPAPEPEQAVPPGAVPEFDGVEPPPKHRTFGIGERIGTHRPEWLVKPLMRKNTVSVLFGESGSRKTWLALDLGLSVATGTAFLNRFAVKKGRVFYIISEGADDFEYRCMAWCKTRKVAAPSVEWFAYRPASYDFQEESAVDDCLDDIRSRIQGADLVIVDTLQKNFLGDTDTNVGMAVFMANMEKLRLKTGATVMPIHHTGWGNTDRERGGRVLRDSADTSILVAKTEGTSTMICKKQKMGVEFPDIPVVFDLVRMPEYDTSEDQVTALVGRYSEVQVQDSQFDKLLTLAFDGEAEITQSKLIQLIRNGWIGPMPGVNKVRALIQAEVGVTLVQTSTAGKYLYTRM